MTPMMKRKITYKMTIKAGQFLKDSNTMGVTTGLIKLSSITA